MLFRLVSEGGKQSFRAFKKQSASELKLAEKDLENWLSENSYLLFGSEEVLVISQSVSGKQMADILALDAEGNLIIVEIKRDWSDRSTVGQLLEYAANSSSTGYENLSMLYNDYCKRVRGKDSDASLIDSFRDLIDDDKVSEADIPKGYRISIVAPDSDAGLHNIIEWLKGYGVPISFEPFTLYASTDSDPPEILLEIKQLPRIEQQIGSIDISWKGDWFYNSNERWFPGSYKRMFDQNVIAICGYDNGPENLEGSESGQRVFVYVNEKGVMAMGRIVDGKVIPGDTIFDGNDEFHLKVEWEAIVDEENGIKNFEFREKFDHGLPVRNVFCGMYHDERISWIVEELKSRSNT